MRRALMLTGALMLCPMPAAAGGTEPAATVRVEQEPAEICRVLLEEAQQVSRVLRTVSDRESADKAADELNRRLQRMNELCISLEAIRIESEEELRELTTSMRSLTHIIQGSYPVVQRLLEVNAYGSEKLVQAFNTHRVPTSMHSVNDAAETEEVSLHLELGDALEDVLYYLRKVRSEAELPTVIAGLPQSVEWVENCQRQVEERMGLNTTRNSHAQLMPAIERCRTLRRMILAEKERLESAGLWRAALAELVERAVR